MELPNTGLLKLGRDTESDVVLRDSEVGDTVLQLEIERPRISVLVVSGKVIAGETTYTLDEKFNCNGQVLCVGKLRLYFDGIQSDAELTTENASVTGTRNSADPVDTGIDSLLPGEREQGKSADTAWTGRGRWVGASLLGSAVLVLSIISWQVYASLTQQQPSPELQVQSFISDAGLDRLSVERDAEGLVLVGTLSSNAEQMQVESFLRSQPFDIRQDFLVLEQLRAQLEDVFRINGIGAKVTLDKEGVLQVATQVSDQKRLDEVRQAVAADIPQLKRWKINNVKPAAPIQPIPEDPDKRVAMVISDEPAHVLTVDQTRYFIGSLLPSGHRIKDIKKGRVVLSKGDMTSELEF